MAHYFPEADSYAVTVRLRHEETGDLKDSNGALLTIENQIFVSSSEETLEVTGHAAGVRRRWRKSKSWLGENGNSIARLALALVPAILALVARAKDQVLKLDLFPALSAVFLAGFGSDQVKDLLLSQKSKT